MFLGCVCTRLTKIIAIVVCVLLFAVVAIALAVQPSKAQSIQTYQEAVVVSNGHECAEIGVDILRRNGSAIDAAIATLFCEGVACPQSTGLGGGFLSVHYERATGEVTSLDARQTAPGDTHSSMFDNLSSTVGGAAVAVPGELSGYGELYNRYGKLPWAELVQPTIDLCRIGHRVSEFLATSLASYRSIILAESSLRDVFIDPLTNDVYKEGDILRRPDLARTLEIMANEGPEALNNGSLTQGFVDDIRSFGGIITVQDMNNYRPLWKTPIKGYLNGNAEFHTMPLPGSGAVLSFILNMITGWVEDVPVDLSWHRIVETFKYAYAQRTGLGDPENPNYGPAIREISSNLSDLNWAMYHRSLVNDDRTYNDFNHYGGHFNLETDHGTAHICVIAPNGDAVSITSTINSVFGAQRMSPSTGIVLNNLMDNFAIPGRNNSYGMPPSPSNYLHPNLRPLSSMSPTIIVKPDGDVKIVAGAAGGTKITTQVAITIKHLMEGLDLDTSINSPRLHHQLMPMLIEYEHGFREEILQGLSQRGHNLDEVTATTGFAAVTVAARLDNGELTGTYDTRRTGSVAGF